MMSVFTLFLAAGLTPSAAQEFQRREPTGVECINVRERDPSVDIVVESVRGSQWQDATVYVKDDGQSTRNHVTVMRQRFGVYDVRYWGRDFDLRIDVFLDGRVRPFVSYSAQFNSKAVNKGKSVRMRCQFTDF